jgi:hypothetical protein
MEKQYNIIFLAIISFILLISLFKLIDYLDSNDYIVFEAFQNGPTQQQPGGATSHTVDLPLTTITSCKNFCGPTARCSITGQQCSADIDCPGCQTIKTQDNTVYTQQNTANVIGDNAAGKLTLGVTPQYSSLTSGYGTHETIITKNMGSKPAAPNFGVDTWLGEFNEGRSLFDKRYKPNNLQFMPNYKQRYSLTGEFMDDGPFPSNSPLI